MGFYDLTLAIAVSLLLGGGMTAFWAASSDSKVAIWMVMKAEEINDLLTFRKL